MARLIKSERGVTLLDLIISIVIATLVFFAATRLLMNFGNFSYNFVKAETSLTGTAVGAFEDISGKITAANKVVIRSDAATAPMDALLAPFPLTSSADGSCIQIRVDTPNTAADYTDDTVYTYWFSGGQLFKTIGAAPGSVIAKDLVSLSFQEDATNKNKIQVNFEAKAKSGSLNQNSTEKIQTTAIMRSRSAQVLT